jgi:hypothetical protein
MNIFHDEKPLNLIQSYHFTGGNLTSMISYSCEIQLTSSIRFIVK